MEASQRQTSQIERLEERVAALERQVQTLSVAVDAASRLRLSSGVVHSDIRVAGGQLVRRILEKGGLVRGYPELPCPE